MYNNFKNHKHACAKQMRQEKVNLTFVERLLCACTKLHLFSPFIFLTTHKKVDVTSVFHNWGTDMLGDLTRVTASS